MLWVQKKTKKEDIMHRSYSDAMLPKTSRKEWRQRFSFRQKSLKSENQVSLEFLIYLCHTKSFFRFLLKSPLKFSFIDYYLVQSFNLYNLLLG